MKNTLAFALLFSSVLLLSAAAHAGYKTAVGVVVGAGSFSGQFTDARASTDSTQYIYCFANIDTNPLLFCYARNSAGATASCKVTKSSAAFDDYARALATIGEASAIQATFDASGNCTSLRVTNSSAYAR